MLDEGPDEAQWDGSVDDIDGTDDFALSRNVNFLLRRAHARADYLFTTAMEGLAVTPRQAAILYAANASPGCSLTELSRISAIDRGTIAEMLPRLVSRGLLTQDQAVGDARAKSVSLTRKGRTALQAVRGRTPALRAGVLSTLPPEYHELMIKMLRLLVGIETEIRIPGSDNRS